MLCDMTGLIKRETACDIDQAQIDDYNNDNDVETEGFEYFSREDISGMSRFVAIFGIRRY